MNKNTAVLLINLGTPKDPSPEAVGQYLKEFLLDPEVIDIPRVLREFFVRVLIVPRRKFRSSDLYQKIWTSRGSPLAFHTKDLQRGLEARFPNLSIYTAFRYGEQNLEQALRTIEKEGFRNIVFLPLYPQYATSSTRTVFNKLKELGALERFERTTWTASYHDQEFYLGPVEDMIREKLRPGSHLLFSYHGIPERHVTRNHEGCSGCVSKPECSGEGDELCYRRQCTETSRLLAARLGLSPNDWSQSYQSRLGRARWLRPSTEEHLQALLARGVDDITLVLPGFSADCLETLEEVDVDLKEKFLAAGGKRWDRVMCLNSEPRWVDQLGQHLAREVASLEEELNLARNNGSEASSAKT